MINLEGLRETYPELICLDDYDEAILGVITKSDGELCIAYSQSEVIRKLMSRDGMTYEDAMDYFEYNIQGSWIGNKTPIFVDDDF